VRKPLSIPEVVVKGCSILLGGGAKYQRSVRPPDLEEAQPEAPSDQNLQTQSRQAFCREDV
jgi:hypothetical protein